MIGAVILVLVIVVAIPVGFLVSTGAAAGIFGFLLQSGTDEAAVRDV